MQRTARKRTAKRVASLSAATTLAAVSAMAAFGSTANAAAPPPFNPKSVWVHGWADGGSGHIQLQLLGLTPSDINIPAIAPQEILSNCAMPVQDGKTNETKLVGVDDVLSGATIVGDQTVDNVGVESQTVDSTGITESDKIEGLTLLGGGITADALTTIAHTSRESTGVNNHLAAGDAAPSGLNVVNLNIFGQVMNGNVPPNTKIPLDANNYVELNEQIVSANGIEIKALDVHLDAGYSLFKGELTVGHAKTMLRTVPVTNQFYQGDAFAAQAVVKTSLVTADTGKISNAVIPSCFGGSAENHVANVSAGLPNVLNVVTSGTAQAHVDAGASLSPNVVSSEDIQALNVLSGTVTADALHTTSSTNDAAGIVTSTGTTTFTNLVIAGQPIAANPKPNTKITVSGLGVITLNKQGCASGKATACSAPGSERLVVAAIEVRVDANNTYNLPASAVITIAHSFSGLTDVSSTSTT